ncbi:Serine hydrolase FSH [Dillenia turbinata]|uniref:Serine hydrolase FSH n=1 Tax=Dillenia turbinata TaxID=194707 RepID=A0AAN8V2Q7_9MAGN
MRLKIQRKPRVLCLHGYRTSGEILKKMVGKWPKSVLQKLDLVFLDGPFLATGKSALEGIHDPPYYEWFHNNRDFREFYGLEECLLYIEDCMIKHGPFDGILGFSQGAVLAAALPGIQSQGAALTKVPKIKFLIIISGGKFGGIKYGLPKLATNAYSSPVQCPSLHFLGETDFQKADGVDLMNSFVDPIAIHHPKGHTVPRLDKKSEEVVLNFIQKIEKMGNQEKLINAAL